MGVPGSSSTFHDRMIIVETTKPLGGLRSHVAKLTAVADACISRRAISSVRDEAKEKGNC